MHRDRVRSELYTETNRVVCSKTGFFARNKETNRVVCREKGSGLRYTKRQTESFAQSQRASQPNRNGQDSRLTHIGRQREGALVSHESKGSRRPQAPPRSARSSRPTSRRRRRRAAPTRRPRAPTGSRPPARWRAPMPWSRCKLPAATCSQCSACKPMSTPPWPPARLPSRAPTPRSSGRRRRRSRRRAATATSPASPGCPPRATARALACSRRSTRHVARCSEISGCKLRSRRRSALATRAGAGIDDHRRARHECPQLISCVGWYHSSAVLCTD